MAQEKSAEARPLLRRLLDFVFGYDFFISYCWNDGGKYALALSRRLEKEGFEVFLDRDDYATGDDWKKVGAWTLRRTSQLILVGSPGAFVSEPVAREVELFSGTGRRIVPIVFGGSLDGIPAGARLSSFLTADILRIADDTSALPTGPSDAIVAAIRRTFTHVRQDKKRMRTLAAIALFLFVLAAAAVFFAIDARHQKATAEANARETFVRQADLSASIAFRMFGEGRPALGLKVARAGAPTEIDERTPLTDRLALALTRGWAQVQEEAELRHGDGDILDATWSPDGKLIATATEADPPRVWNAATGDRLAVLGAGIQRKYTMHNLPEVLSFDASGKYLATQFGDDITVWDALSWSPVFTQRCEAMEARYLRLSADGGSLAAQCKDGVHLWDRRSGKQLYHKVPSPDVFEFTDSGGTLVIATAKSQELIIVESIASGSPTVGKLGFLIAPVQKENQNGKQPQSTGFTSIHATNSSTEIILRSGSAVLRADLKKQTIVWRKALSADWVWFQTLPASDGVGFAELSGEDIHYSTFDAKDLTVRRQGILHFTGDLVGSRVNKVGFSAAGDGVSVTLNSGALVIALDRKGVFDGGDYGLQILKGDGLVVYSGRCSGGSAEAGNVKFTPDGSRIYLLCSGGVARVVRLREPAVAQLTSGQSVSQQVVRFGSALLRLGGSEGERRFEIVDPTGKVSGRSDVIQEDVSYWIASEAGAGAVWISRSGAVRSWRIGSPGFVVHPLELSEIRAARFDPKGNRVALLDKAGKFVRLRLGEGAPEFSADLGGASLPSIEYAIDATLSNIAFTTTDLEEEETASPPRRRMNNRTVVVRFDRSGGVFTCRESEKKESTYINATFWPAPARLYLVRDDKTVEVSSAEAGATYAGFESCERSLVERFLSGNRWKVNNFSRGRAFLAVPAGASAPGRLIFGGAETYPLELIDLESKRAITDLSPKSGGKYPVAISADGKYLQQPVQFRQT